MSTLSDLQNSFFEGIFRSDKEILQAIKSNGHLSPEQRLQIYRNNSFVILTDVLKQSFPALVTLSSDDFFNYLAREFIKSYPPENGDMNSYGSKLPKFLQENGFADKHPFLTDVAKLEWLRQESSMAANHPPLKNKSPHFSLHPSVRFLSSHYPIIQLWKLGNNLINLQSINMNKGENVLIFRQGEQIVLWQIKMPVLHLITSMNEGTDLEPALEEINLAHPRFDIETTAAHLITCGIIVNTEKFNE